MRRAIPALALVLWAGAAAAAAEPAADPFASVQWVVAPAAGAAPQLTVVRYWTSWCVPCKRGLPAFNQLVQAFAGRPVRFLSISNEEEAVVRKALAVHPIEGPVGFDPSERALRAFGVRGYPTTLLLDGDGRLLARTGEIGTAVLEAALRGEAIQPRLADLPSEIRVVRGTPEPDGSWRTQFTMDDGLFVARGAPLSDLLQRLHGLERPQIVWEIVPPTERYDIEIRVPGGDRNSWRRPLAGVIGTVFGVETRIEEVSVPAARLRIGSVLADSAGGESALSIHAGEIRFTRVGADGLATVLGEELGRTVHLAPGCRMGPFDGTIRWDALEEGAFESALAEQGVELEDIEATEPRLTVSVARPEP